MILFLSGNFPTLSDPKEEQKLKEKIEAYGSAYNRLVTFYHKNEAEVGINIQRKPILRKRR